MFAKTARLIRSVALATFSAALTCACSLLSPADDSLAEDKKCGAGFKSCDGSCVNTGNPSFGCTDTGCDACALSGAAAICVAGQCRVGTCEAGLGDCNGSSADGCETNLESSMAHCGSCGASCAISGAVSTCSAGQCSMTGCAPGFADCNASSADGCEVDTKLSVSHCGACGNACLLQNAGPVCQAAKCAVGTCAAGWGNCDGTEENGCETDLATSAQHCGACDATCPPANAQGSCSASKCQVTACNAGFADCNTNQADGCEVDLRTSAAHCGACNSAVSSGQICADGVATHNDAAFLTWLKAQNGGFCNDKFNEFMNLCGETSECPWNKGTLIPGGVPFCCDPAFMKQYPDGIAVDLGFHWDGVSSGVLFDIGGDCDKKRIECAINTGKLSCGNMQFAPVLDSTLPLAGRFIVSYRATKTFTELWVNGVLQASGGGTVDTPELVAACGPGFIVGQRISFWWEQSSPGKFLRLAPFLVHLKDQAPTAGTWTSSEVFTKTSRSVVLFEAPGASAAQWTDSVAGKLGLKCGGKLDAEKDGYTVPCDGPDWVVDVAKQCF